MSEAAVAVRSAIAAILILLTSSQTASAQLQQMTPATDLDSAAVVFAFQWPESRSSLIVEEFYSAESGPTGPLDLAEFLPAGVVFPGEAIRGEITLHATPLVVEAIGPDAPDVINLPALTFGIAVHGDRIVPVPFGDGIVVDRRQPVHLLPGVGRVWKEMADEGPSRALMPVSLVDTYSGAVRNGVLTFLYGNDAPVSKALIQFSQETAPGQAANATGWVSLSFEETELPEAEQRIEAYGERQASSPEYMNWTELQELSGEALEGFDADIAEDGAVSASGLILDGAVYIHGCTTRHGPYPFCRQMRHAVGGLSLPLLGAVGLSNFAGRFGAALYRFPIGELAPELLAHPRWGELRPIDIIDMASGLGETGPVQVPGFVDADNDESAIEIRRVSTEGEKLEIALRFPTYPWNAGEVFRYRTADAFGLALALHRLSVERYTGSPSLRQALQNLVFGEIGIPRMQMIMSDGETPTDRVPDIAEGLLPTTGELMRLALLLRRTESAQYRTPLEADMIREAFSSDMTIGRPTGRYWLDGEARFHFGFWRIPFRASEDCLVPVAAGIGAGGTVMAFLPNGLTVFRVSDVNPDPDDVVTLDMFRVAHAIRPACG